jgi:hypothetical protein
VVFALSCYNLAILSLVTLDCSDFGFELGHQVLFCRLLVFLDLFFLDAVVVGTDFFLLVFCADKLLASSLCLKIALPSLHDLTSPLSSLLDFFPGLLLLRFEKRDTICQDFCVFIGTFAKLFRLAVAFAFVAL